MIICKELNKPESLITFVGDRKGHDMRYAIDPTKIHNELGWLPETKFEDGIKKTIKWYLTVSYECERLSGLLSSLQIIFTISRFVFSLCPPTL